MEFIVKLEFKGKENEKSFTLQYTFQYKAHICSPHGVFPLSGHRQDLLNTSGPIAAQNYSALSSPLASLAVRFPRQPALPAGNVDCAVQSTPRGLQRWQGGNPWGRSSGNATRNEGERMAR